MATHVSLPDDTRDPELQPPSTPRCEFITRAAALAAAAALGCGDGTLAPSGGPSFSKRRGDDDHDHNDRVPRGEDSGIEHVVLLMMENRSFDHMVGWVPRADGRQAGLVYRDRADVRHRTHALTPDYQGCGHPDPYHSYEGGREQYNGGRADGFLRSGDNDVYAIGYYVRDDLPFFRHAVVDWSIGDRFFGSIMGRPSPTASSS